MEKEKKWSTMANKEKRYEIVDVDRDCWHISRSTNQRFLWLKIDKKIIQARFTVEKVGFSAKINSVEGCVSQGDTLQEALDNVVEAYILHQETFKNE